MILFFTQMNEEDYFDWSFLDSDKSLLPFIENLSSFQVLVFANTDVDMRVLELQSYDQIREFMKDNFPMYYTGITTMTVKNESGDEYCPYFRMFLVDYSPKTVINYKLQTFMRSTGIVGIHSRCTAAVVVGLLGNDIDALPVEIPVQYRSIKLDYIDRVASPTNMTNMESLCGNQGLCIPSILPLELHWNIMKYLRHPCADMISAHRDRLMSWLMYWDNHFSNVFAGAG